MVVQVGKVQAHAGEGGIQGGEPEAIEAPDQAVGDGFEAEEEGGKVDRGREGSGKLVGGAPEGVRGSVEEVEEGG